MAEPTDITGFVPEIANPLWEEIFERAPSVRELSRKDRDAILSAIYESTFLGILRGVAVMQHDVNERIEESANGDPDAAPTRIDTTLMFPSGDDFDIWAAKYGE